VALISTDRHRVGALAQLRGFAELIGIPVHGASNAEELATCLRENAGRRLILIDNAGFSPRDGQVAHQLSMLRTVPQLKILLVLPTNLQRGAVAEVMESFRAAPVAGCVLTKLDESVSVGAVLEHLVAQRVPAAYVSEGQRVPEDLHVARPSRLVEAAVQGGSPPVRPGPMTPGRPETYQRIEGVVANGYF
jgi:flagellar biosynthesis protein FlhF